MLQVDRGVGRAGIQHAGSGSRSCAVDTAALGGRPPGGSTQWNVKLHLVRNRMKIRR